ncbi:beta-N-acetylhexosaminidase [Reichenbachiella carrageenanivorans]|uniref:beta-N-acetylhexosaminidase n=1 Tax=Reichenbachiella carrageenanivorans TaxID=2979869 RepID=A0ABY6D188_9BACT|nr:beta-N-acetylhexosaminidase [Reichenbachiella carrageenanivorans]UXX79474.1 beta-N-acetylhexosaminidase [Reichenbachiella carrageenanivorans]
MNLESKYSYVLGVLFIGSLAYFSSCTSPSGPTGLSDHTIIPHPVAITTANGHFTLSTTTQVGTDEESLIAVAQYLVSQYEPLRFSANTDESTILLSLHAKDSLLGTEGYSLQIQEEQIHLSAQTPRGIFYGIQTLLQLLPPAQIETSVEIPTGTILDYPRYSYRGSMLDVSRHFFGVDVVKRYIDFIAAYKLNTLHLHLSDDQGWRIEIKSKPKLTSIGSTTQVGGGKGGYFTQAQYQEIVQYAADQFITVIPEIDLPGHTQAALASYPALGCTGEQQDLYTGKEVGFSTLCTDNEATYEFVDAVLKEIAEITPGPYLHIGGDESHATKKEDYIYFINRIQQIVNKYGKTLIGWDEVAEANIAPESIVQQWKSAGNASKAAENGNRIILSPATLSYMDMKYDTSTRIGYTWAALIEVDQAYNWDPDTITMISSDMILGIEAPLWTETIETIEDIEYMVFPRLLGYAEIGWSPQSVRDWANYRLRLAAQEKRFEEQDIHYYRSPVVPWLAQDSIR